MLSVLYVRCQSSHACKHKWHSVFGGVKAAAADDRIEQRRPTHGSLLPQSLNRLSERQGFARPRRVKRPSASALKVK